MALKQVKIKKIRDNAKLPESKNGNWYDCYISKLSIVPNKRLDWKQANDDAIGKGAIAYLISSFPLRTVSVFSFS